MHPEQIKAAIRMKGTTPTAIAARLGVTPTTVWQVIQGRGESARIKKAISEVTGLAISTLWAKQPAKPRVNRRLKAAPAIARRA